MSASPQDPPDLAPAARAIAPPPGVVAVADDDPIMRETFMATLAADGHRVFAYADGHELLNALDAHPFELFVLDVKMPRVGGFAVLEALRRHPRHFQVPSMIVTSYADADALQQADTLRAAGFLMKPIDWPVLHFHVRGLLRLARAEQDARALRYQAENRLKYQQVLAAGGHDARGASHRRIFGFAS